MNNDSCVRLQADVKQIKRCGKRVSGRKDSFDCFSKALELAGNNVRLKILYLLYEERRLCVCDLRYFGDERPDSISAFAQAQRQSNN